MADKTASQRLEAANKNIHKLAAAAAEAAAAAAGNDPTALKDLPAAYRTIAASLQTKIAALSLQAAEVEAVINLMCGAWRDCVDASDGGF
jgi:hypothetical protein